MMTVDAFEQFLGAVLRRFRREQITPLAQRVAALERDLAIAERLCAIEARIGIDDGVEAKLHRGEQIPEREWLSFVRRIQPRAFGAFDPARHSSWRGGQ
jgi:hypothetical protein